MSGDDRYQLLCPMASEQKKQSYGSAPSSPKQPRESIYSLKTSNIVQSLFCGALGIAFLVVGLAVAPAILDGVVDDQLKDYYVPTVNSSRWMQWQYNDGMYPLCDAFLLLLCFCTFAFDFPECSGLFYLFFFLSSSARFWFLVLKRRFRGRIASPLLFSLLFPIPSFPFI